MLPIYTPKHEFPVCQHATHDVMGNILRQNSSCGVRTMHTKFGCDLKSLEKFAGSVWPRIHVPQDR